MHRCRLGEAQVFDGTDQFRREAQLQEAVRDSGRGGNCRGGVIDDGDRSEGFGGTLVGLFGLHRRKVALHCKSVGHLILTRNVAQGGSRCR
jgi:hypothetical protein